ncbi:hypothetical protein N9L92_05605 [Saprospiraceae bacterium]|nr:hypothetical protein [Saprospiraceae bacterium]
MKGFIKSIVDLYIYSSIHVAIVATLFCAETFFFICHEIDILYLGIVFFSTLFMYSLHRIIGISKVKAEYIEGRYKIILKFKTHLKLYAFIALIGIIFCLAYSSLSYLLFMVPLGIISLLYAIPFLSGKRRLRDVSFIKIFLIGFVWSAISIAPIALSGQAVEWTVLSLVAVEKLIYIIAITIPFDIRDVNIDQSLTTQTIPHSIGIKKSYFLTYGLIILALAVYYVAAIVSNQPSTIQYLIAASIVSLIAVLISKNKTSDYFYSGLLDGVIGVRAIIIIIGSLGSV